jgi:hypothetical protein
MPFNRQRSRPRLGYRLIGLLLVVVVLSPGCSESQPAPDEKAKNAPPAPPVSPQDAAKKSGRPIPKSIKDRSQTVNPSPPDSAK